MKLVSPAGSKVEVRDELAASLLLRGYRVDKSEQPARAKRTPARRRASGESK